MLTLVSTFMVVPEVRLAELPDITLRGPADVIAPAAFKVTVPPVMTPGPDMLILFGPLVPLVDRLILVAETVPVTLRSHCRQYSTSVSGYLHLTAGGAESGV